MRRSGSFERSFTEESEFLRAQMGTFEEGNVEALPIATWHLPGVDVRLAVEHHDKEDPFVLAMHVLATSHRTVTEVKAPGPCGCSNLKPTENPFTLLPIVLVSKNPSLRKTHLLIAKIVRGDQAQGCFSPRMGFHASS